MVDRQRTSTDRLFSSHLDDVGINQKLEILFKALLCSLYLLRIR